MAGEKASADAYINEKGDDVEKGEDFDDSKVKFINGKAEADGDVSVQISKPKAPQFAGMEKEELLQFANDPFWKKLRLILFIGFWVIWIAMLVAAIIIIVVAPKCPPKPDLDWYQEKTMYQIYPRSFKDTDGNGIGDLKGVYLQMDCIYNSYSMPCAFSLPINLIIFLFSSFHSSLARVSVGTSPTSFSE